MSQQSLSSTISAILREIQELEARTETPKDIVKSPSYKSPEKIQYEKELDELLVDIREIIDDRGADPPDIRKVKDQDAKSGVPMAIYWTTRQMVKWIEELGFPMYRGCFETNNVTGRHLILLDASTMPKLGIHDFEHIKKIAAAARELLNIKKPIRNMKNAMSDPMIAYIDAKRKRGSYMDHITFQAFLQKNRKWYLHYQMP